MLKKIQLSTKFDTPHGPPQATQKAPTRHPTRHKPHRKPRHAARPATSANPTRRTARRLRHFRAQRLAKAAASDVSGRSDSPRPPPQTFQGAATRQGRRLRHFRAQRCDDTAARRLSIVPPPSACCRADSGLSPVRNAPNPPAAHRRGRPYLKKAPFPYVFRKRCFHFFIILNLISITRPCSSHMTLGFSPLRLRRAA